MKERLEYRIGQEAGRKVRAFLSRPVLKFPTSFGYFLSGVLCGGGLSDIAHTIETGFDAAHFAGGLIAIALGLFLARFIRKQEKANAKLALIDDENAKIFLGEIVNPRLEIVK